MKGRVLRGSECEFDVFYDTLTLVECDSKSHTSISIVREELVGLNTATQFCMMAYLHYPTSIPVPIPKLRQSELGLMVMFGCVSTDLD